MSNNSDQWNQQPGNDSWSNPDQSNQSQSGQSTWNDQSSSSSWGDQSNAGWNDQSSSSSWNSQPQQSSWDAQSQQSAPSWGSQQPSSGWDQPAQQSYQPYGAPAHPASPYGYPAMTGYQEAPDKGPGVTALVLALLALGISLILSVVGGLAYKRLFEALGSDWAQSTSTVPDEHQGDLMTAGLTIFGQLVPTILGIVALVLAGRAMGKPGSKGMGVVALITALAAPVISFIVWVALVGPAAS